MLDSLTLDPNSQNGERVSDAAGPAGLELTLGEGQTFSFDNVLRNTHMAAGKSSAALPKATSTGTTIVGCVFDGGIVLGADTRATEGPIIADKNCEKVS